MEKFTKYAEIPMVAGGVVFSDPFYAGQNVWCAYEKAFNPSSGWVMKMESTRDEDGYAEFALSLGRRTTMSGLRVVENEQTGEVSVHHYAHHDLEMDKEIGMYTARMYIGSMRNFQRYGEEAAFRTGTDGLLGGLSIVTCKGEDEPSGFLFMGTIDTAVTDEDRLFSTVVAAFDGHEIDQERFEKLTDPNSLEVRKELAKELRRAHAFEQGEQGEKPHEKVKGDIER